MYGMKLLVLQLKNLVGVVIVIIYNTKIFVLARKRQNSIDPQSNIKQPESIPHHDDNQWAQHMANQLNPLKFTNLTSDLQSESRISHETPSSSYAAHISEQQVTTDNFRPDVMNLNLNVPSIIDDQETGFHSVKLKVADNDAQTIQDAKNRSATGLSTIQTETDTHTNANTHDNLTQESGVTTFT